MASLGYVRVSTREQHADLQQNALAAAGVTKIFADIGVSGSKTERPELDRLLDQVREGDVLVVWKLDRLGRNTRHVLEVIEHLHQQGAGFRSLTEGLDTTGPMGKAMLTIMAAFAELERSTMLERTRAGLEAAKARGRLGGRPRALDAKKLATLRRLSDSGQYTRAEMAAMLHVSEATVYRALASG